MSTTDVRNFLLHMEWADAAMWKALLGVPSLSRDPGMQARVHHFHSTQTTYLQLFRGLPVEIPEDRKSVV